MATTPLTLVVRIPEYRRPGNAWQDVPVTMPCESVDTQCRWTRDLG
jgi:hypothetical protein